MSPQRRVFTMQDAREAREKVSTAIAKASVEVLREAIVDGATPKPRIVDHDAVGSQFSVALDELVRPNGRPKKFG